MKDNKEKTAWETFKDIPNRIISLFWNLISRWGVALLLTFWLVYLDKLTDWYSTVTWIIFMLFFLFKTEAPEMLEKIIKIKELK